MTGPRPLTREQLLAQCDPDFLHELTKGNNGPLPARNRTLGPTWVRFVHDNCVMGEGDKYGQPAVMEPEQQALYWKMAEIEPTGEFRFELVLLSLGKGSGKSPILAWRGCIEIASDCAVFAEFAPNGNPRGKARPSAGVTNMASSYEQADLVLDEMRASFEHEDAPMKGRAFAQKGEIIMRDRKADARRIPATPRRADGAKRPLLLVDEVHELTTENQERAIDVAGGGTAKRENGQIIYASTAGNDLQSFFGRQVARGKRGGYSRNELFVVMEAKEGLDPQRDDHVIEGIKQSNPLARRGVANPKKLLRKFREMPPARGKRYYWNQWVPSDESWLPLGAWDAIKIENQPGIEWVSDPDLPTWLGADMALKRDSAAIIVVQQREDGRYQAAAKVWLPDGGLIDQDGPDGPDNYIRSVNATHNVIWNAADEAWWPTLPLLEKGTMDARDKADRHPPLPIFRMPQQGKQMIIAYARTYRWIVDGLLLHRGEPDFSDQISAAVPDSSDGGWRLRKGKAKRRIDCAPALAGAVFASGLEPPVAEPVIPKAHIY